ncbi:carboxymuconolactone decarboxylase family protein [Flavimaricola sp.]|nr:carboxymuconolactone decarboxylase family protein [Flavimaricola sp.]MDA9020297.1 carboxymuconolactone decarboxylase family protein [Flavimaricola sp.]
MASNATERLAAAKGRLRDFASVSPELMQGFGKISKVATSAGNFSAAQKELIATAIAATQGCEDCILYHVDAAKRHGATEANLIEALSVAVEMGGGPAVMYAGKALAAFRDL